MKAASVATQRQVPPPPDREAIAAKLACATRQLVEAASGLRDLEQILRIDLGTLGEHEQSQSAAISFRERREIMNTTIQNPTVRELMSAKDVAVTLAIDERSLRRLRSNRAEKFPRPVLIGKSKRWRVREVQEWIESRRPE